MGWLDWFKRLPDPDENAPTPTVKSVEPESPPAAICPYCGVIFDQPFERSRKCPDCRKPIVVRTDRGRKVLLRDDDARVFDLKRKETAARNDALRRLQAIGCDEEDYVRKESELRKKWHQALPRDVFWQLANESAIEAMKKPDWHRLGMIYFQQARLLYEEGRPHLEVAREAQRAFLRSEARNNDILKGFRISASHCCPTCAPLDGRQYSLQKALETMPIPRPDCERGWCNCSWIGVTKSWDEILKPKG